MGQPHKHAAIIKAWADGAEVQYSLDERVWTDLPSPMFANPDATYRVKPKNITVKRLMSFDYRYHTTRTYAVDHGDPANIEFTFDPDGKLLDAKVLK